MTARAKATAVVTKRMSTESLLDLTDKVAAELARRVDELQEGQKKLGVEGLRLQSKGMQRIIVQFPRYHKQYEYDAPISVEVGDTVKTPTSYTGGPCFAEVVALGTKGCYSGPIKEVLAVYKKVG
ncbi:MAG: hypothetical protein BWY85_01429 [Firmicutes bacterium ADurb.Bin506]|nr:MAG: hypothetical protein BWY85_01429 [Firmicutes bacterium ADurb.Bin506]